VLGLRPNPEASEIAADELSVDENETEEGSKWGEGADDEFDSMSKSIAK
jgi:hypothetical protein